MVSLALLLSLAAAPPGQFSPAEPALVFGRVVDAGTGRPIAGAIVIPAGTAATPEAPATNPARVISNAEGHFVLRGLAKGSLVLTATKGGYVDATYGQRRPGGSTQPIPVAPGQWKTDVELRMWKYAAIAGVIVDEAGDPVVGARVQSLQKTFIAGRRRLTPASEGVTDDRGFYRIARLTPGDYTIVVPSTQTSVPTDVMESFFTGAPISDSKRLELSREMNSIGSGIAPAGSPYALNRRADVFPAARNHGSDCDGGRDARVSGDLLPCRGLRRPGRHGDPAIRRRAGRHRHPGTPAARRAGVRHVDGPRGTCVVNRRPAPAGRHR